MAATLILDIIQFQSLKLTNNHLMKLNINLNKEHNSWWVLMAANHDIDLGAVDIFHITSHNAHKMRSKRILQFEGTSIKTIQKITKMNYKLTLYLTLLFSK